MKYDHQALRGAQRDAFRILTNPAQEMMVYNQSAKQYEKRMLENKYWVKPENVSTPVELVQEQAFVNTTQVFNFDFSINGQPASNAPGTNNVILGKNNIAVVYGIKIYQGEGANANNRIYRSRGITVNDDSLYNSIVSLKLEQSVLIDKVPGQNFRDVFTSPLEFDSNAGMVLINPMRILTGELGTFTLSINLLTAINALVLSANIFLSARLCIVYGQASATR